MTKSASKAFCRSQFFCNMHFAKKLHLPIGQPKNKIHFISDTTFFARWLPSTQNAIKFQPDSYSLPENLNLSSRLEIIGISWYFAFEPEDITHKKNNRKGL